MVSFGCCFWSLSVVFSRQYNHEVNREKSNVQVLRAQFDDECWSNHNKPWAKHEERVKNRRKARQMAVCVKFVEKVFRKILTAATTLKKSIKDFGGVAISAENFKFQNIATNDTMKQSITVRCQKTSHAINVMLPI